jgi:hypothetical protein
VKIEPSIRSPQNHHQEIFMMNDELIGFEGRIEEVLVLINPAL